MKLDLETVTVKLRTPWETGHGTVTERELLLLRLQATDGTIGHGEAAPMYSYDSASMADVRAGIEDCRGILAGADGEAHADVLARCAEAAVMPQSLAAIDLALWDIEGRRAGEPLWRLLGAPKPEPVAVNYTLASADRAGAASEAAEARVAGFGTLKAKVAIGDDHARLAAIRAFAGPEMKIRIDANGAWTVREAEAALEVLKPVGIEFCEEPVSGLEAIGEVVLTTDIPVALDESASDPMALDNAVCALVCLKISTAGGLSGLLDQAHRARRAGYEVFLASTLDGPLGIAAALHASAVLRPSRACGLATLAMFAGRGDPLAPLHGAISVPLGPGLGHGLAEWYRR